MKIQENKQHNDSASLVSKFTIQPKEQHLLFAIDLKKAEEEINKLNGHVTVILGKHVFLAYFRKEINLNILKHSFTNEPEGIDRNSKEAARSYTNGKKIEKEKLANRDKKNLNEPKKNHSNKLSSIRIPAPATSEKMLGNIGCKVFIVNGPTPDLQFTTAELDVINASLAKAGSNLATFSNDLSTKFTFIPTPITIDAQPISGGCTNVDICENIFKEPVLIAAGVSPDYDGILTLCNTLINEEGYDWGFVMFIVKYPILDPAYTRGAYSCYNYKTLIDMGYTLPKVVTHETCHIFGAADEYSIACSDCSGSGLYNVPNNNCVSCHPEVSGFYSPVPCLMLDATNNDTALCSWSMGQVGWYNTAAHGDPALAYSPGYNILYVFYVDGSNQLSLIQKNLDQNLSGYNNITHYANEKYLCYLGTPAAVSSASDFYLYAAFRDLDFNLILATINTQNGAITFTPLNIEAIGRSIFGDPTMIQYNIQTLYVAYRDNLDGISLIQQTATGWQYIDLSGTTQARQARKDADPYIIQGGFLHMHVFYIDNNGNISSIAYNGSNWNYVTLGIDAGAPEAGVNSGKLSACLAGTDSLNVVYTDINNHISLIYWDDYYMAWKWEDLTQITNAPLAQGSEPSIALNWGGEITVVYRSDQFELNVFHKTPTGNWTHYIPNTDLFPSANPPKILRTTNEIVIDQQLHVVYTTGDAEMAEIYSGLLQPWETTLWGIVAAPPNK